MNPSTSRILTLLLGYLVAQAKTYPMQTWPMYPQSPREYADDEYYYTPKVQYYYDAPAMSLPDVHEQVPYPFYYDPYGHNMPYEIPKEQEERLAALPIGQETWFESDPPRWRTNDVDDVSAAFLDNLILTQMAQDAQRRRENARAAFPPVDYEEPRDVEDEDVRELKALAGKPLYHVPKTVPKLYDEDDYVADDGFINWNGNKRSATTAAPTTSTQATPTVGQKEIMVPRPAQTHNHQEHNKQIKRTNFYETIAQLLANKSAKTQSQVLNSVSLHQIKKQSGATLRAWLELEHGPPTSEGFLRAQNNFVESAAAYALTSYLLQLKDRHNGNILLDSAGHIIHIDFGFIFSISPKNLGFESSPFKLTQEFVEVMDGEHSDMFQYFKILILRGLIAARKHCDQIIHVVELMRMGGNLACLRSSSAVSSFRARFHAGRTEPQLQALVDRLVRDALNSLSTRLYDNYQYYTNGIL